MRGFGLKDPSRVAGAKDRFRRRSNGQCKQPNHPDHGRDRRVIVDAGVDATALARVLEVLERR